MTDSQVVSDEEFARRLQQEEFRHLANLHHGFRDNDQDQNLNQNNQQQPNNLRRNVIDHFMQHEYQNPRIVLGRIAISLCELIITITILSIGWNESCSQPLNYWLLVFTLRNFMTIPLRVYIYRLKLSSNRWVDAHPNVPNDDQIENDRVNPYHDSIIRYTRVFRWLQVIQFLWFLVGQSFLFTGKHCQNTAPTLWYYTLVIVIFFYISLALPFLLVLAICICLPCVLVIFRFFGEPEGANTESIRKLPTKTMEQGDIEKQSDSIKDDDEVPKCPICWEDYKIGDKVRVLPCKHQFHIDCVDKWLPLKKVCPLCRHDITKGNTNENLNLNSPLLSENV